MNNVKSQKKNNEMENLEKVKANDKPPKSFSWWRFDDEYITGWQYLGRSIVSAFLALFLVGLYLNATTAYKRAKSLGNSDSSSIMDKFIHTSWAKSCFNNIDN